MKRRILIVKIFYQNQESLAITVRKLRTHFGRNEAPASWIVQWLVRKFEKTGSAGNVKPSEWIHTQSNDQQVDLVQQNIAISSKKSIYPFAKVRSRWAFHEVLCKEF